MSEPPSTKTGPLSPEEYEDRIEELFGLRFADARPGDEVTDEEAVEALRWLLEGPKLTSEELFAFLQRNQRLHVWRDRAFAKASSTPS